MSDEIITFDFINEAMHCGFLWMYNFKLLKDTMLYLMA